MARLHGVARRNDDSQCARGCAHKRADIGFHKEARRRRLFSPRYMLFLRRFLASTVDECFAAMRAAHAPAMPRAPRAEIITTSRRPPPASPILCFTMSAASRHGADDSPCLRASLTPRLFFKTPLFATRDIYFRLSAHISAGCGRHRRRDLPAAISFR